MYRAALQHCLGAGGGGGEGKGEKERHIVLIVLRLLSPIVVQTSLKPAATKLLNPVISGM